MSRSFVIALLGLIAAAVVAPAAPWQAAEPLPQAIAGHAAAVHADNLWIVGGSYWTAAGKQIETAIRRRALAGPAGWATVGHVSGGFAHGGWANDGPALWLVGGLDQHGPSSHLRRVDLATGRVETVAALPEPRVYGGAAWLDHTLWVVGGTARETDFAGASATVWQFDPATRDIRVHTAPGPRTINPLLLALDGELHVLPGGEWSAATQRLEAPRDAWIFSPRLGTWRRRPLAFPLPRGLSGVGLDNTRALLAGGVARTGADAVISAAVWHYDARSGDLRVAPPLPQPLLGAAVVAGTGGDLWLLGGEDAPRSRVGAVWWWPAAGKGRP